MMDAAAAEARELILAGVQAGRYERAVDEALMTAIAQGEPVPLERIGFDSLGWMEFCISVEVNSGLELTPAHIADMSSTVDVERWLVARRAA